MLPFFDGPLPTRTIEATVGEQPVSIELPIRGAILAGEHIHAATHRYQNAFNAEAGRLADALLADGFEPDQAERIATRILSLKMHIPVQLEDSEHRAMIRHSSLVADIEGTLREAFSAQQIRKATAVVRFRVKDQRHWTDDDTEARIPQPVIEALAGFFDEEQGAGIPQRSAEEIVEGMIETLGKLAPSASASEAEPPPLETPSTSPTSSGEPEPSGPATQPSLPSASPTRRSRTSSKRSAGARATS